MPTSKTIIPLSISPQRWWGWQEVPSPNPGWGASPVFITNIVPLKTGKGLLRIEFIQVIHPGGASRRSVDLKVVYRTSTHLVGTLLGDNGELRTCLISAMSFDWLRSDVPLLWQHRPALAPGWTIDGVDVPGPEIEEYLAATFGKTENDILTGVTAKSFRTQGDEKPDRVEHFTYDCSYGPFASWLISRGLWPASMDDKWFIYLEGDRLVFRRSWTGHTIYIVEANWRGDKLHLGQVEVNRDSRQYSETEIEKDKEQLTEVINSILLRTWALAF